MIRFSTAPGEIMPDGMSAFRDMAIKVIGVEGSKPFSSEPDVLTPDFLMINRPAFLAGNVTRYLNEQLLQETVSSLALLCPDIYREFPNIYRET